MGAQYNRCPYKLLYNTQEGHLYLLLCNLEIIFAIITGSGNGRTWMCSWHGRMATAAVRIKTYSPAYFYLHGVMNKSSIMSDVFYNFIVFREPGGCTAAARIKAHLASNSFCAAKWNTFLFTNDVSYNFIAYHNAGGCTVAGVFRIFCQNVIHQMKRCAIS